MNIRINRRFLTFLIIFVLTGLIISLPVLKIPSFFKNDANIVVDWFLFSEGKSLAKKYGLRHRRDESEMFNGEIEMLGIVFDTHKYMTKAQAREILLEMQRDLVFSINKNESLLPFLKIKPFSYKNVLVSIYFFDKKGGEIFEPNFCIASLSKGIFRYCYHKTSEDNGFSKVERETYEEATQLLEGNSKKVGNIKEQGKTDAI